MAGSYLIDLQMIPEEFILSLLSFVYSLELFTEFKVYKFSPFVVNCLMFPIEPRFKELRPGSAVPLRLMT